MVTGGLIAHPIDAAPDMLRFYRDAVAGCSDDLTVFAGLVHAPGRIRDEARGHGRLPHGRRRSRPSATSSRSRPGARRLSSQIGRMPYPVMNTILDAGYPAGALNYWLSSFTGGLTDGLIDAMVERFASVPSPMTVMLLEHFHGAVTRVGVTDTAVPHRAEGWNLVLPSVWTGSGGDGREHRLDARDAPRARARTSSESRWVNYLGDDQGDDAVRAAYGPNYERLLAVKRRVRPARTSSTTTTTSTRAEVVPSACSSTSKKRRQVARSRNADRSVPRTPGRALSETRTFARLCTSLTEEAEAIGWYQQRLALEADREARAIMADAQGEEFKHFCMDLEFLLRRTPLWREIAQGILFQDGDIVEHGEAAEEAAVEGAAERGATPSGTSLGIGSLKGAAA